MFEFISANENLPFSVAIAVMLIIALMEGVTTLLGAGLSSLLETLLPEIDIGWDVDAGEQPGSVIRFLSWLRVGEVPFLMLLVIFLTAFGLLGWAVQGLADELIGSYVPASLAGGVSLLLSLPMVRGVAGMLNRVMPKDESEAVSSESFIGKLATITLGQASSGKPSQAKLRDEFGLTHYVMVEPARVEECFQPSESVLIVSKNGAVYAAIRNENTALID